MDIYRSTDKPAGMDWSMRSVFAALVLSALVSVSAYSATPVPNVIQGRITEVTDFPPVGSGYIVTWIGVTVFRDDTLQTSEVLIPYASDHEELPIAGERCMFKVHDGMAGGWIGRRSVRTHPAILVDSFRCGKPGTHSAADLNENRAAFDGKEVTVRGYLWIGAEQLYIVDRRFYADDAWKTNSGCLSLLNIGALYERADVFNGKYVELNGKFVENRDSYGVSLMACGETGIDLHANPGAAIRFVTPAAPFR
ncbi:hypothetical protein KPL74_04575 [Bacillus sp. NP157]|nr:hypothetical protein KPL74_04575 [Bacillus sp. NP157]